MEKLTVRETAATLPAIDDDALDDADSLQTSIGFITDFRFSPVDSLRSLNLTRQRLTGGRVTGLRVEHAALDDLRMHSVEFNGCDLSTVKWAGGRLSRVRLTSCKLIGAHIANLTVEDVVFDRCKLDYATLENLTAKGPVIFTECGLTEAILTGCDLSGAAFDQCAMNLTTFERGTYKNCDLRGNDLSSIRGTGALRRAVVDRPQLLGLAEALAADLDLDLKD